jgi:predicted transglutaminase-like cysteine proteinase
MPEATNRHDLQTAGQVMIRATQGTLPPIPWDEFLRDRPEFKCPRIGNPGKRSDLESINDRVNAGIIFDSTPPSLVREWAVWPVEGQCGDYALTKYVELLKSGWPTSALRIAVVAYDAEEAHAILIARCHGEDWVLDNIRKTIVPFDQSGYRIKQVQSLDDPTQWVAP